MSDPIEQVLAGLRIEKERIALTEEMGRRAGISQYESRNFLAREQRNARMEQRPVDMVRVAWAIHDATTPKEES